ncbi:MAG: zf-HC2 domain-containing protein [Solirubrobacterales bacterium]|nr:zf-HC2 domain-containing protein [Solirubrobacterales bacterium]
MPGPDDLTCAELVALVTDYLEGALPPAAERRIDEHLESCEECSVYVEQLRATIAALGGLTEDDVEPPVLDALLAVFRRARPA